jgi:N6-L-threonylcarbamoyladenine synthase
VNVLGIESSCDECAAAVVRDGRQIVSDVVYSQIEEHRPYAGVVPEIASRKHIEWIDEVVARALREANTRIEAMDAIAVTHRPGLIGSLLVGLSYAKGLALASGKPLVAVDHIQAHLHSPALEHELTYPHLALLLSGGHTLIVLVSAWDRHEILGATIDDACGEAFDKVAKHFEFGYPGGVAVQELARHGDADAYRFPVPSLHKGNHPYDVSYSGLKTAVVHQREQFRRPGYEATDADLAASFQRTAIDIVVDKALAAAQENACELLVAVGGVAANTYLRARLDATPVTALYPSLRLCTDNAAMIAGLGYHVLQRDGGSGLAVNASARVAEFRARYPYR